MLGLFGLLDLGSRSLTTHRQAVEVAGHNLSNVNNPAYARQRLSLATSLPIPGDLGPEGTGVQGVAIVQLRSAALDFQLQRERSVLGSLQAQQDALRSAQSALGQLLDRIDTGAAAEGVGTSHSLADDLASLFDSFQSLSTNPASLVERQNVLMKASALAAQFQGVDQRLDHLRAALDSVVKDDTTQANSLLAQIAQLNAEIARAEIAGPGAANDLRDVRQSRIEDLAKLVKIDVVNGELGTVDVSISGTLMVAGLEVVESMETYVSATGQTLLRAAGTGAAMTLTGGRIQGTIEARDGVVAELRADVNSLASLLITEVNGLHQTGYSLTGSTGADFFVGSTAADIQVNSALRDNPALLQAASVSGAEGDNGVALALAQLARKSHAALGQRTFVQGYTDATFRFGHFLASVNTQLTDQEAVEKMLVRQREAVSGVSLDEEMTDLTRFQAAFQASARLVTVVDDLLNTVVNLKQ